ncbi:hypothetical protein F5X99DRAFT_365803 [Biscogniauxia marginata]|nr:hypothetical protein F5X99DRAFT_365803 [Biscogniauxia marginata]
MKISRIDRSIYGAILFGRLSPTLSSAGLSQASRLHNGYDKALPSSLLAISRYGRATRPFSTVTATSSKRLDPNFFTSYLPSSCNCSDNAGALVSSGGPDESALRFQRKIIQSKQEMIEFVPQYDNTPVDEYLEIFRDPYMRKYAPADGPKLVVSDREEDVRLQSIASTKPGPRDADLAVEALQKAILIRLRNRAEMDLDTIWEIYHGIPEQRVAHLTANLRHALLAVLGDTERNSRSMLRYFAVVADVKKSGFSLIRSEWNTAISFAARYVAVTTEVEVEAALRLWREMEHDAGVKASEVTFNILFDAASKAGKFNLAEMIYQEMTDRGLPFNRYHHVSLIHFFGLKQDSDGMRAAYREMVEAGEIIDTTTLNAVIAGFIRAGDEDAALRVYEKMKAMSESLRVMPDRNYALKKSITKVLLMFAKVGKEYPDMRSNFQKTALLSPDIHTYRILINHFGVKLGNLSIVARFLDEMKYSRIPVHGAIFLALFKGFSIHAGPGSEWNVQRLNSIWEAFLEVFDSGAEGLHISTWLAMAVLKAFSQYSSREELLDIYECLRSRWDLDEANSQFMLDYLRNILIHGRSRVVGKGIASYW